MERKMKDRKLGKGLTSLFGEGDADQSDVSLSLVEDSIAKTKMDEAVNSRLMDLRLSQIYPNKNQPRKRFDEEALEQLAKSIKSEGVVQPVVVRKSGDVYELVSGERRWRASQKAELKTIPAILVDVDDNKSMQIALIENIQREDLNPIEKAKAFRNVVEKTSCTQDELAERIGMDRSTLANFMRLTELPGDVQESVSRGTISMGHARALLALQGEKEQRAFAKKIEKDGISVRKLENMIRLSGRKGGRKTSPSKDPIITEIADKLSEFFGTRVTIEAGKKRGRILIDYYENSQLNDILTKLNIVI
jgi:ParB family chromosome partitioning protein